MPQKVNANDAIGSFLEYLYTILMGGNDKKPASPETFVTYLTPGIPFADDAFDFAAKGLAGGKDADETRKLIEQMTQFSQLVDFIPSPGNFKDKMMPMETSQARLSNMYGEILRQSKVVNQELTDKEKEMMQKITDFLWVKKVVDDDPFDEMPGDEKLLESPQVRLYRDKMRGYEDALMEYTKKWLDASTLGGEEGKRAALEFQRMGNLFWKKVTNADADWISGGYKNIVEIGNAKLNQITQKSLVLWKQRLLDQLERYRMDACYQSSVIPGNFMQSAGWQKYKFTSEQFNRKLTESEKKAKGSAGFSLGIVTIGGSGGGSVSEKNIEVDIEKFSIEVEICQVPIVRNWFYPEWFMNRGWDLPKGAGWTWDKLPSNGDMNNPDGICIGYAGYAIFARKLVVNSLEIKQHYLNKKNQMSGRGGLSIGPFVAGGSGGRSQNTAETKISETSNGFTADGLILIATKNWLFGKAPNLLPDITPEELI